MNIQFSRWLAIIGGILIPLLETMRRWSTWQESPEALFDDYLLGGFLLFGAWRVGRDTLDGQRFLTAAWAFACGLGYYSFFGQLDDVRRGEQDPAPISAASVLLIKGIAWALAIIALAVSLRRLPSEVTVADRRQGKML